MKYTTVKLTEDQIMHLKWLLAEEYAKQYGQEEIWKEELAFNLRLQNKLSKAKRQLDN